MLRNSFRTFFRTWKTISTVPRSSDHAKNTEFHRQRGRDEVHRQIARNNFLAALSEIEHSGINGLPVEGNPLRELRAQIWPAWHDAMHRKADNAKTRQYVGFRSKIEERHRAIAVITDQIDQWARRYHLVERHEQGNLRPAGWVLKFAYECCDAWSKEALGILPCKP